MPAIHTATSVLSMKQWRGFSYQPAMAGGETVTNWSATGPSFNAISETYTNEFVIQQTGQFFRLREVP